MLRRVISAVAGLLQKLTAPRVVRRAGGDAESLARMNVTWIPAWEEALPPRVRGVLWRSRRALRHRLRAIALTPGRNESIASREELAIKYVRGEGIEVGALNMPLQLPAGTRVQYVDHAPTEELQRIYWHGIGRHNSPLVVTDVVDDAEHLHSFADASLDFVLAN